MNNENALFVACRGGGEHQGVWKPVGRLEFCPEEGHPEKGFYRFCYTRGAEQLPDFIPFTGMHDLRAVYESYDLFPLFANRLLSESRPEYADYLKWGGFDSQHPPRPLALLGVTEGRRATDNIEVFPCPQPTERGYVNRFFVHGVRHLQPSQLDRIKTLKQCEKLAFELENDNSHDSQAIKILTLDGTPIGYLPRYLARDVRKLKHHCPQTSLIVEYVNLDAPLQQRILCQMTSCWYGGVLPCDDGDFEPIVA